MTVDEVIDKLLSGGYGPSKPYTRPKKREQVTGSEELEIIEDYQKGVKVRCIAGDHNILQATLYKVLNRNGVKLRGWNNVA